MLEVVLAILTGAGLLWLGACALCGLHFVFQWGRRKVAQRPEPPRQIVETAQPYELRYKLGDMRLSWEFESAAERDQFRVGFREGLEYQLEALYRDGRLRVPHHMDYGPVPRPAKRQHKRNDQGPAKKRPPP